MEPLSSKVAEQRLSQLCAQLETCQSIDDVQKALSDLDASAISRDQAEMVLHQLLAATQVERLTELVLTSGGWAQCLSDWLLETFPTNVDQFLFSIHLKLIYSRQYRIRVELTPKVMSGLTAFHSEEQGVSQTPLALVELDGLEDGFIGQKIKQSVKKQARKAKHQAALFSLQDLECLGIEEPHSRLEADATAHSLLGEVQKVLQKFLSLLHYPDVASTACKMFVVEVRPTSPAGAEGGVNEHTDGTSTPQEEPVRPVAYPYVQPMKASLYFENPKGFGDWRMPGAGTEHSFEIYIKKIKELSKGHFSTDNQKRLNGADLEVPLYEAKMTGNTRLVYQNRLPSPEYGSDSEKQVIKVFGIFTHAQINRQIWEFHGKSPR
ncbi:hypothetical protein FA13DRAFT_1805226 [Coprinellus micaceus]|uniref:Uncharacterized protein n=1 Tax=Coprinellus micaceus TaxID=71717 RepID=A0A4Y7S174_COPMI|nr:hypothetical protein FA13DRAFT_1805226 [Coprinellus micaceus]